jgi:hypothetical protein
LQATSIQTFNGKGQSGVVGRRRKRNTARGGYAIKHSSLTILFIRISAIYSHLTRHTLRRTDTIAITSRRHAAIQQHIELVIGQSCRIPARINIRRRVALVSATPE